MKRTLVAVKIRSGRGLRDVVHMFLLLLGVAVFFALIALMQIVICKSVDPDRPALDCIRSRLGN